MDKAIQRSFPVLETYDPNWESRHDAVYEKLQATQEQLSDAYQAVDKSETVIANIERLNDETKSLLEQLHAAFHAQFRTGSDYKAWCQTKLEEAAKREGKPLAWVKLQDEATVPQINEWMKRSYDMLAEQDFKNLPIDQPRGLTCFGDEPLTDAQRTSFYMPYKGFYGLPSATRCTMERTNEKASVCFHHLPNATGTSPTNLIERLATETKKVFLPNIEPQNITFFIHIPVAVGGPLGGEAFLRVDMPWTREGYGNPTHREFYKQVPHAISEAIFKPYDEPPFLAQRSVVRYEKKANRPAGFVAVIKRLLGTLGK